MSALRDPQSSPGVWIPPPLFYAVGFGLGLLLHRRWPVALAGPSWIEGREIAGVVSIFSAMALLAWAVATCWRARTTIIPHQRASFLVRRGPYRWSRNPMYVGMTGLYLGMTLVLDSPWPLLFLPAVLLVIDRYVIHREESHLEARFGADYEAFRRGVRRWL